MLIECGAACLSLWLSAAAAPGLAVQASDSTPQTALAEAVALALARNDRVAAARQELERARLGSTLARSAFETKLTPEAFGSFGGTSISNQSYGLTLSRQFAFGTEVRASASAVTARNQLGNFYSSDTTVQLTQPLLRGAGASAARRGIGSADFRLAEAARRLRLVEQEVAIEVAAAFHRVAGARQLQAAAAKAVERARTLLEASLARLQAGRVSRLDVLRAEQLVSQAESQRLDADAAVEDGLDQVRLLTRSDPEDPIAVPEEMTIDRSPVPVEQATALALEHRLELQAAAASLDEAEQSAAFTRRQQLPRFDLNLALTRRETADSLRTSFGLDRFGAAAFVGVAVPIEWTARRVGLEQADLEIAQRRRELDATRAVVVLDARRAVREHARAVRRLELDDQTASMAEKEVELATLRFQRGLSNNLDVVTAETNLLAARARRLATRSDVALARLRVLAATGTLDPGRDVR